MLDKAIEATERYALDLYNNLSNQRSEDREADTKAFGMVNDALNYLEDIKTL